MHILPRTVVVVAAAMIPDVDLHPVLVVRDLIEGPVVRAPPFRRMDGRGVIDIVRIATMLKFGFLDIFKAPCHIGD